MFVNANMGELVPVGGTDRGRDWSGFAFVPAPLGPTPPLLQARTHTMAAEALAALARLDARASLLPNPSLLRQPALRREAQSTSALEGTYAPLEDVLAADEDDPGDNAAIREVVNFIRAAESAFDWVADGKPLTLSLLEDLQGQLVRGTRADISQAGRVRTSQVVIGGGGSQALGDARFVPPPPGPALVSRVRDTVAWLRTDYGDELNPVTAAGVFHYQFETLHPFNDGNGRIGRLLIVLQLLIAGVITEPTLTVSPWFEARRGEYYDLMLGVSMRGDWDPWLQFFARGISAAATSTTDQLVALLAAGEKLKDVVRTSALRSDTAIRAVDVALAQPVFTARRLERELGVSYGRANKLVEQLVELDVLRQTGQSSYNRRFYAPAIMSVLVGGRETRPGGR